MKEVANYDYLDNIKRLLPEVVTIPITLINAYGFGSYVAKKLNLKHVPDSYVECHHGWIYGLPQYSEEIITVPTRKSSTYLVMSKSHKKLLKNDGYKNVHAIGTPYIYIDNKDINVPRYKNTLLVMPIHSTDKGKRAELNEEEYIQEIDKIRNDFDLVVFSLHKNCIVNDSWISTIEKYGFNWILGADISDANALKRQNIIFRSFEYVTTNSIGSHVAYAAYSGAKVSFFGKYYTPRYEDLAKSFNSFYFPFILDHVVHMVSEKQIKKQYKHLFFNHPKEATHAFDWAMKALGHKHKVPYKKLAKLFGWTSLENLQHASEPKYDFSKKFNNLYNFIEDINKKYNKIIIYGEGTIGKTIKNFLNNNFVAFVDKESNIISSDIVSSITYSPENIKNMNYDIILVSVLGREESIVKYLNESLNIDKNKIITIKL